MEKLQKEINRKAKIRYIKINTLFIYLEDQAKGEEPIGNALMEKLTRLLTPSLLVLF